ncbi:CDP-alcohol phosphatidyltransferase family protein [Halobacteria archaeon AArc-dxtr1]|nr:CDP-alcohol phosphatidyltransferase family protein [Halobacteria archaeon AArc-dxtr1]
MSRDPEDSPVTAVERDARQLGTIRLLRASRTQLAGAAGAIALGAAIALVATRLSHPAAIGPPYLAGVTATAIAAFGATAWTITRIRGGNADAESRATKDSPPTPLTTATILTLGRVGLVAGVGGFALVAYPEGTTAWLPAMLFGVAAALDGVDGALARATGTTTVLGEKLDASGDSLTVLVGAVVAVSVGFAPVVYLAAGAARYAFVGGIRYREFRDRPVYPLPPSQLRRVVGVCQLVAIFLALSPLLGTGASRLVTTLALAPLLASFGRDWLAVSGRLGR